MAESNELVLVSRCCYGGANPFVKNVLDRSIPYLHPYFAIVNGEMHHRQRYNKKLTLTALFYGKIYLTLKNIRRIHGLRLLQLICMVMLRELLLGKRHPNWRSFMKIALINGSPKTRKSSFETILLDLTACLGDEQTIKDFHFCTPHPDKAVLSELANFDALIFAMPLYIDDLPSHMVSSLIDLEKVLKDKRSRKCKIAYPILNCGFYEGHQNAVAVSMMNNWCVHAGLSWGGGRGMLSELEKIPLGHGPKKNLGKALNKLSEQILSGSGGYVTFINANFPRFLYKVMAEYNWRKALKKKWAEAEGFIQTALIFNEYTV